MSGVALAERTRDVADAVHTVAWAPVCEACQTPLDAPQRRRSLRRTTARHHPRGQARWPPLAAMMRRPADDVLARADLVVPVPLHRTRRWRNGFNQAAELAAHLGVTVSDALRHVRPTPPQIWLSSAARRRGVRGAFTLSSRVWASPRNRSAGVNGRWIVVAVDVMTIEACAAVLRGAGARVVLALTAARAETRPPARSPRRRRSLAARRPHAPIPGDSPAGGSCP